MSEVRIGTSGWSYPGGKGPGTASSIPCPARRPRRPPKFDELAFYAEHFDTVEINSTFYRVPTPGHGARLGRAHAAGLRVLAQAVPEVHAPGDVPEGDRRGSVDLGQKDVDEFRAALDPLASAGKLGALLAQFPASFKNEPESRGYLEWLLEAFRDYPVAVELRHEAGATTRRDAAAARRVRGRLGADRRAEVPALDPPVPAAERADLLLPAPARPQRRAVVEPRNSEDRYNYLYSAEELEPFAEAAEAASREVRKAYVYANNHFSAKSVANAAILKHQLGQPLPGEYPEEFVERISGPERAGQAAAAAAHSRTEAFLSSRPRWIFATTSMPLITRPKTVYLPSSSGAARSVM